MEFPQKVSTEGESLPEVPAKCFVCFSQTVALANKFFVATFEEYLAEEAFYHPPRFLGHGEIIEQDRGSEKTFGR